MKTLPLIKTLLLSSLRICLLVGIIFASCDDNIRKPKGSSFTDSRDGIVYKTVETYNKKNKQIWMVENLNYDSGNSKCYDDNPSNCQKYGRLYDWDEAMKACPKGWHLPNDKEWKTLVDLAGGDKVTGKKVKSKWTKYGFSEKNPYVLAPLSGGIALYMMGGGRSGDGSFISVSNYGNWWSSSEYDSEDAIDRGINFLYEHAYWNYNNKSSLFSVRCVMD